MLVNEPGDYTVFFNQIIEKQTSVALYTVAGVSVGESGRGILKINQKEGFYKCQKQH